jgi:hypothetical protein
MSSQSSHNNIKKVSISIFTIVAVTVSILALNNFSNFTKQKSANALSLPVNDSNLIIGTKDTGSDIELSVCVQATPGPIHLANVSTWFEFNTSALATTTNTFIQKGQYGNSNNGYGTLKWQQVAGAQNGSYDTYTMSLVYSGDGETPGLAGLPMSTSPELFGRVNFTKVPSSTASTALNLVKKIFYSTENTSRAISQNVSYVNGDCVTSNNVITQSSSSVLSSSSSTALPSSLVSSSSRVVSSSIINNSSSSSQPSITIVISPNAPVPNITIPSNILGMNIPNNTQATFKFPGSSMSITGSIMNNVFIPNPGQIVPNDAFAFYGANSFGSGFLTVGSQVYNIPTNVVNSTYSPSNGGGSITISLDNKTTQSTQVSKSSISTEIPVAAGTQAQTNLTSKNNGVLKSKLEITDPYVCGVGSYGNVPNAKDFGVDNVYYDFYKEGSTVSAYSFKLKLNNNGDFFLPISSSSNLIAEGKYRVVYYALDSEGNKSQGEYTDFITDNCSNIPGNPDVNSVRTGGSDYVLSVAVLLTLTLAMIYIVQTSNKSYSLNSIFGKK